MKILFCGGEAVGGYGIASAVGMVMEVLGLAGCAWLCARWSLAASETGECRGVYGAQIGPCLGGSQNDEGWGGLGTMDCQIRTSVRKVYWCEYTWWAGGGVD